MYDVEFKDALMTLDKPPASKRLEKKRKKWVNSFEEERAC